MKQANVQVYTGVLSQVIDSTSKNGSDLNDDFELVRNAIDNDKVAEIGSEKLLAIKQHFQSGTDVYQNNLQKLEAVATPVKLIGRQKQMISAYRSYAQACQIMTNSILPDENTIDVDAFNQSEKDQEAAIAKVSDYTTRIMNML
ncbi:hypothetical protein [Lentilactobacillus kribbianus]|uniref:hypothetical protein n=1 Tax=Lentilactobacillus kribbianus TaxID=2729622 RepID=UPI0015541BDC|nr:hypothetical protein [Lentilactobacillus kribbianus]